MSEYSNRLASAPRKQWLDAIKGVAIILVIMSHSESIPRLHVYLTACYMPLFFLASGYVYVEKKGGLLRKWKQLLTPYFAWSLFYLLCACAALSPNFIQIGTWISGIAYSRFSLDPVITETSIRLFPPGANPMWFLTSLAISYAGLIPLLKIKKQWLPLLILLYFVVSIVLSFCPILLPWSIDTVFITSLFVYVGYRLKNISPTRQQCILLLLASGISYILLTHINGTINISIRQYGNLGIASVLLFTLIGILGTAAYSSFFMLVEKSFICRFFAYFGRISLTILCSHMLFIHIFNKIQLTIFGNAKFLPKVISIPTRLTFVLLMCVVVHYLISYIKTLLRRKKHLPIEHA